MPATQFEQSGFVSSSYGKRAPPLNYSPVSPSSGIGPVFGPIPETDLSPAFPDSRNSQVLDQGLNRKLTLLKFSSHAAPDFSEDARNMASKPMTGWPSRELQTLVSTSSSISVRPLPDPRAHDIGKSLFIPVDSVGTLHNEGALSEGPGLPLQPNRKRRQSKAYSTHGSDGLMTPGVSSPFKNGNTLSPMRKDVNIKKGVGESSRDAYAYELSHFVAKHPPSPGGLSISPKFEEEFRNESKSSNSEPQGSYDKSANKGEPQGSPTTGRRQSRRESVYSFFNSKEFKFVRNSSSTSIVETHTVAEPVGSVTIAGDHFGTKGDGKHIFKKARNWRPKGYSFTRREKEPNCDVEDVEGNVASTDMSLEHDNAKASREKIRKLAGEDKSVELRPAKPTTFVIGDQIQLEDQDEIPVADRAGSLQPSASSEASSPVHISSKFLVNYVQTDKSGDLSFKANEENQSAEDGEAALATSRSNQRVKTASNKSRASNKSGKSSRASTTKSRRSTASTKNISVMSDVLDPRGGYVEDGDEPADVGASYAQKLQRHLSKQDKGEMLSPDTVEFDTRKLYERKPTGFNDAALEENEMPSSGSYVTGDDPDSEAIPFKERIRNLFKAILTPHKIGAEFDESIMIPNLQFTDAFIEKFYFTEFGQKRMKARVYSFLLLTLSLILFQLWFDFGRNPTAQDLLNSTTPSPQRILYPQSVQTGISHQHDLLSMSDPHQSDTWLFEKERSNSVSCPRRRLGDRWTSSALNNGCMLITIADIFIVIIWFLCTIFCSLKKLETINLVMQGLKLCAYVFFAQGVFSPCTETYGLTFTILNNLAVGSLSCAGFNSLGLARMRRASILTVFWAIAVLEVTVVIARGPDNFSSGSSKIPALQVPEYLALYCFILAIGPLLSCICRMRAEVAERESMFYALMYQRETIEKKELEDELDELKASTENVDVDKLLGAGIFPNTIVQLAVIELKLASKSLETMTVNLPRLTLPASPHVHRAFSPRNAPEGVSPRDAHNSVVLMLDNNNNNNMTTNVREEASASGRRGTVPSLVKPMGTTGHRTPQLLSPRNDHYRPFSKEHGEGLNMIGAAYWDATYDLGHRIDTALKLLTRSRTLFDEPATSANSYQTSIMFHALGHEVDAQPRRRSPPIPKTGLDGLTSPCASSPDSPMNVPTVGFNLEDNRYVPAETAQNILDKRLQDRFAGNAVPFSVLSGLGELARSVGLKWTLDLLKVTDQTNDEACMTVALLLVSPIVEKGEFPFDLNKFYNFASAIQNEYGKSNKIPYHNRTHAAIHAHTSTVLATWIGVPQSEVSSFECLGLLVASLCHDVGHPGRTNAYLVNANRRLAIIYNDISVLENLHACKTFETMRQTNCNFLANASNEDYRMLRKMVIDLILATDMKLHFELINMFRLKRNCGNFNILDEDNRLFTFKMIMKAADLSHGAFEWPVHETLSKAVNNEFWNQGDAEARLGIPISPLCDRAQSDSMAKSQCGFIEFVVMPLFVELSAVDPSGNVSSIIDPLIKNNLNRWKQLSAQPAAPQEIPKTPPVDVANKEGGSADKSEMRKLDSSDSKGSLSHAD